LPLVYVAAAHKVAEVENSLADPITKPLTNMNSGFVRSTKSCALNPQSMTSVVVLLTASMFVFATESLAIDLIPIPTSGFDQDIIFEAGLATGQAGANGELGSRQFFEQGVFADGVPRSVVDFVSTITGNNIDFDFAPFQANNILKFDNTAANTGPKTLTLDTPAKYGQLAVVHSGGSMSLSTTAFETALLTYTINYVGGATQTGTINSVDWGAVPAGFMPAGTEIFLTADRTTANATTWPVASDNNTTANRWAMYISEITTEQPTVNIQSVAFGPVSLNTPGTPLNGGDDVVVFGLSGSGQASVLGDTDGDGTGGEYPEDFAPIQMNFRKDVSTRSDGDLVRNGSVDFDDFHQWKTAFLAAGGSLAGLDLNLVAKVPEPTTFGLATVVACGLAGRTRLRRLA
jgi:hypothetical protein